LSLLGPPEAVILNPVLPLFLTRCKESSYFVTTKFDILKPSILDFNSVINSSYVAVVGEVYSDIDPELLPLVSLIVILYLPVGVPDNTKVAVAFGSKLGAAIVPTVCKLLVIIEVSCTVSIS